MQRRKIQISGACIVHKLKFLEQQHILITVCHEVLTNKHIFSCPSWICPGLMQCKFKQLFIMYNIHKKKTSVVIPIEDTPYLKYERNYAKM